MIINKEHLEAHQNAANKKIEDVKSLSDDTDAKFEVVKRFEKELIEKKVKAFIFPLLPGKTPEGKAYEFCYQFNTLAALSKWNGPGETLSEEDLSMQKEYLDKALYTILHEFTHGIEPKDKLQYFFSRVVHAAQNYHKYFE